MYRSVFVCFCFPHEVAYAYAHTLANAGLIITADQRSTARTEMTTDREKFVPDDQFDRLMLAASYDISV